MWFFVVLADECDLWSESLEAMDAFPRRWGAYVLIRPLGGGGMGDVFLALQGRAGREKLCVVKRLVPNKLSDPDRVNRFRREAEIVRHLAHGAIAQTLAVDELDGEPYIVQEFIEGRNISQLVAAARSIDGGAVPSNLAIHIVREVSRALAYAHGAGVVHRDVAPDNVMITFSGEVRLIDFGIARSASDPSLTEPGVVVGRWNYTAPEVLAGARADRRADVYAAGVLLWELLTGRAPSFADLEASPAPSSLKPELSSDLDAVVLQATAADPTRRFASAEDLQRALGPLLSSSFVGEQALRGFVGRCYDVEVQRRRLADEVAEARALLVEPPLPAVPGRRGFHIVIGVSACLAVAAVAFARHRAPREALAPPEPSAPIISLAEARGPVSPVDSRSETSTAGAASLSTPAPATRPTTVRPPTAARRPPASATAAVLLDRARDSLLGGDLSAAELDAHDALRGASPLQKARAHLILGKILILRGQTTAAVEELSDAIELDPANEAATAALARIRRRAEP